MAGWYLGFCDGPLDLVALCPFRLFPLVLLLSEPVSQVLNEEWSSL